MYTIILLAVIAFIIAGIWIYNDTLELGSALSGAILYSVIAGYFGFIGAIAGGAEADVVIAPKETIPLYAVYNNNTENTYFVACGNFKGETTYFYTIYNKLTGIYEMRSIHADDAIISESSEDPRVIIYSVTCLSKWVLARHNDRYEFIIPKNSINYTINMYK